MAIPATGGHEEGTKSGPRTRARLALHTGNHWRVQGRGGSQARRRPELSSTAMALQRDRTDVARGKRTRSSPATQRGGLRGRGRTGGAGFVTASGGLAGAGEDAGVVLKARGLDSFLREARGDLTDHLYNMEGRLEVVGHAGAWTAATRSSRAAAKRR